MISVDAVLYGFFFGLTGLTHPVKQALWVGVERARAARRQGLV